MITLIGILIVLIPFLLVFVEENRSDSFVKILAYVIAFNTVVALLTQALGVFKYEVILGIHLVMGFLIIGYVLRHKSAINLPKIGKINWALVMVVVISVVSLYSVHHNYTGTVQLTIHRDYHEVEDLSYKYPYFSDELYAVAFIKDSIGHNRLPLHNPLLIKKPMFPNISAPFHSFLAEIVVLLNLNPLVDYISLSLVINTLIVLLIYLILKSKTAYALIPSFIALSVLYIPNSGNFPASWTLIPITLGILSFLISIYFLERNAYKKSALVSLLTLIYYPPLFFLNSIAISVKYFIENRDEKLPKVKVFRWLSLVFVSTFLIVIFIWISLGSFSEAAAYLWSKIFHTSTSGLIPNLSIFIVIPIWILSLLIPGFILGWKKDRYLVIVTLLCFMWWFLSSLSLNVFLFEYVRIVYVTAILAILVSGIGLIYLLQIVEKKFPKHFQLFLKMSLIIILSALFINGCLFYTSSNKWKALYGYDPVSGIRYRTASMANIYLTDEDLRIFKDIRREKFLSNSWKGMVIGSATDNFPLSSKGGTITIDPSLYNDFMTLKCDDKIGFAQKRKVRYFYTAKFECAGFVEQDRSKEGLVLYKVKIVK